MRALLILAGNRILPGQTQPFRLLVVAGALYSLGFFAYNTVFTNFAVESIGITPFELGLLETIREIPGLLSVLMAAAVMMLLEPVVAGIALLLMAFGVLNYFYVDSVALLIVFSLIWSIGFHTWSPLAISLALRYGKDADMGTRLGILRSSGNIAALAGIAVVYLVTAGFGFRPMFIFSGVMIGLGGLIMFTIKSEEHPPEQRIVIRPQYWLFYVLQILNGGRRHIFMTFAVFALVERYSTPIATITTLFLVNQVVSIFAAYVFGRWIDRYGERLVFVPSTFLIGLVFLGYAFIDSVNVLFVLYVIDNLLFSNQLAVSTYGKKMLVKASDLRPTMVTGQTMNHIAAVIVPITGGILWQEFGHVVPFVGGAVIAAASCVFGLLMTDRTQVSVKGPRYSPTSAT